MSAVNFDQFKLGPRLYRSELVRSVAMRCLALQQFPVENASLSKDIVRIMGCVVKATTEYGEDLAMAALKVSTYLKNVDTMTSSTRVNQILAIVEDLESRIQGLIRYGWHVEREWATYVQVPAPAPDNYPRKSSSRSSGVFPSGYLRKLYNWHVVLANAITQIRHRSAEVGYGCSHGAKENRKPWEAMGVVYGLNPITGAPSHQHAVGPQAEHAGDGHPRAQPAALCGAERGRSAVVQAAQLFRPAVYPCAERGCARAVAGMVDIFGESPLTIAARAGNVSAVKYIVEESGHHECLPMIVGRLVAASPADIAFAMRLSMFYGFNKLFEMICAVIRRGESSDVTATAASETIAAAVDVVLSTAMQKTGGCSMFHLAALNDKPEMAKCAQSQHVFRSRAFDPHARDDTHLTPLDIANYFGYRACADVLLTTFPSFHPPLALELSVEDEALRVAPFVAKSYSGLSTPPDTYAVFVTLGANDMRRNKHMPPLSLDADALSRVLVENGMPRSTHLLLRIDSEQGMEINCANGWLADVTSLLEDPTRSEHTWDSLACFHTVHPERFVLKLELIAMVDQVLLPHASEQKVVAHAAVTLPPTYIPKNSERMPGHYAPVCPAGGSYINAVFISATSDEIVGDANIDVFVSTPYKKQRQSQEKANSTADDIQAEMLPWCKEGHTVVYGHRGSGMNFAPSVTPRKLQLGENTVLSMDKAIRDGVLAVEFDVQMTRDMVPVIYHDWIVAETGLEIPVSALTLTQLLACNPRNQPITKSRTCEDLPSGLPSGLPHCVVPGHACKPMHVANSENTIQAPFATLKELFESLPEHVGFDIEVKYPMPDEADEYGVFVNFEINLFVDRILDVVYSYMEAPTSVQGSGLDSARGSGAHRVHVVPP
ncbi:Glycerophosphoryl diester phosphodiesterase family-domain-containing protein [Kickxella alabastrina]|uniref:Glycerophosphoryl diester phosphodiesterase family-domain-containing protein n=1 Tax=Kickxella alabastrina TaxID=61397 RepID=UPI0022206C0E|nr:Glycerophosphoryl diester phosphodiesterase family-domain-containing protein [Kickxella alabastrina]KAI7834596.1 Glycerophosphoryl diester phosphodiesterase family-domain-containing protein [Kickxella alabastrina]